MMPVCQNIPMSFSKYQRPCFESSPSEPWPYHASHGYPYPYHPCCNNNSSHCFPGFQLPPFFTPQPMRCYGDHYPYPEMHNFYPPHNLMEHTREFGNDTERPRSYPSDEYPMNPKQHMSYPYPILCVPPEFMRNKDLEKRHAGLVKEDEESKAGNQPKISDGCSPIDMNTLLSLIESQKEKGGRREEGKRDFLFPKFLMPYYHQQTENTKGVEKIDEKKISPDDVQYAIKLIPFNQSGKDESKTNLKSEERQKGCNKNENIENTEGMGSRRSLSPSKTSKQAPVCLRVDPLLRKRNQARSSSPPASRPRENCGMLEKLTGNLNTSNHVEPDREKIVKVVDVKKSECRQTDDNYHSDKFPTVNNIKEFQQLVNDEMKSQGAAESITSEASMIWSDEKAAELIQSVYRGYTVRKWDSLKKLKQLSDVKKEVDDVRNRVEDLQSNHPGDEKEKIVIGEIIMRLLLKLDTIQGLLPFVREVRKSLARELVILQGMVDEISMIPSGQSTEQNLANCEEKSSEEVRKVPIIESVVDGGQHLVLDCPTKTLGSDDANTTSDESTSDFERIKNVEEAGAVTNILIAEGETELQENSCEGAGEDTIAVDGNGLGEEEEEAASEQRFSKKITPIVVDAVINKGEELELEVVEQNHPEKDLLQVFDDSVCDENEEIVGTVNRREIERAKSEAVQLNDATSEDQQLEQSQAGGVKEERIIALHAEIQLEENKEGKEPRGEGNGKKVREDEQLREMMEKLMEVGKEQVILISKLSCRVKQLEKELKKKKKRVPRSKPSFTLV